VIRLDKGWYVYLFNPRLGVQEEGTCHELCRNSPTVGDFYSRPLMENKSWVFHRPIPLYKHYYSSICKSIPRQRADCSVAPTPCVFRSITRIEDPGSTVGSHPRVGCVSRAALPRTPCRLERSDPPLNLRLDSNLCGTCVLVVVEYKPPPLTLPLLLIPRTTLRSKTLICYH